MLRKKFSCSELCRRWDIHKDDLTDIVRDRNLRVSGGRYSIVKIKKNTYFYKDNYSVGGGAASTGPLAITDENGFYFLSSDVEAFERENGITNLILPTDDHGNTTSITTNKGDADDTPSKNRIDKPFFDRQTWEDVVHLYKVVLKAGFKGSNVEMKLKSAAKKELTQNKKNYQVIKQKHLNGRGLFALNEGQEKRDFIGNLLKIIVKKNEKKKIGAQKLYQFGKQNYSK